MSPDLEMKKKTSPANATFGHIPGLGIESFVRRSQSIHVVHTGDDFNTRGIKTFFSGWANVPSLNIYVQLSYYIHTLFLGIIS